MHLVGDLFELCDDVRTVVLGTSTARIDFYHLHIQMHSCYKGGGGNLLLTSEINYCISECIYSLKTDIPVNYMANKN